VPLLDLGCELAQGHLFAKAASAAELEALSPCRAGAAPRAATRAS
jgi:EAL domain-containing protein (putative c-di-GMP-specific phosphodiesterase class I)